MYITFQDKLNLLCKRDPWAYALNTHQLSHKDLACFIDLGGGGIKYFTKIYIY